jgi:hypothetical protein
MSCVHCGTDENNVAMVRKGKNPINFCSPICLKKWLDDILYQDWERRYYGSEYKEMHTNKDKRITLDLLEK